MENSELAGTLKVLREGRAQTRKKLSKLDKAIAVIRGLVGTEPTPNGRPKHMSAGARRRVAKAQKLRWAKVRASQKVKA